MEILWVSGIWTQNDPDPYEGPVHKGDLYVRISKVEILLGNRSNQAGQIGISTSSRYVNQNYLIT